MDDLISRQAAIEALNEYFSRIGKLKRRGLTKGEKAISLDTVGAIKTLPSAQPKKIRGQWSIKGQAIDTVRGYWAKCSACGHSVFGGGNYCSNCGSYNKGEVTT